jgi:DNA-directed RNA polymerase subunit L
MPRLRSSAFHGAPDDGRVDLAEYDIDHPIEELFLVSFVLRNLVHDEEEPGDLDASLSRTSCYRFRVGTGEKAIRANLRS